MLCRYCYLLFNSHSAIYQYLMLRINTSVLDFWKSCRAVRQKSYGWQDGQAACIAKYQNLCRDAQYSHRGPSKLPNRHRRTDFISASYHPPRYRVTCTDSERWNPWHWGVKNIFKCVCAHDRKGCIGLFIVQRWSHHTLRRPLLVQKASSFSWWDS